MGRPRVSEENRVKVVSFSADRSTIEMLEALESILTQSRSRILADALQHYHSLILSRGHHAENTH